MCLVRDRYFSVVAFVVVREQFHSKESSVLSTSIQLLFIIMPRKERIQKNKEETKREAARGSKTITALFGRSASSTDTTR